MTIRMQLLMPIGFALACAVASAQSPAPLPAPAPVLEPFDQAGALASVQAKAAEALERAQAAQDRAAALTDKTQFDMRTLSDLAQMAVAQVEAYGDTASLFAQSSGYAGSGYGQPMAVTIPRSKGSADAMYERGVTALDRSRWEEALTNFNEAISRGGSRADGALYWKAYALNKLGRRDEAIAAIAELRKSYPSSRWLDDAKALEVEVKQSAGQKVSPEGQPDDDTKLMALNGLVQSDPDRALPAIEGVLKSAQSPRLKQRALFVLAQSSSPKAQQMLEQVARGNGNPDLQVKAIQYLGAGARGSAGAVYGLGAGLGPTYAANDQQRAAHGQTLLEIYNSATDPNVKRAALSTLAGTRDSDRLLQIVKTEKSPDLRLEAVQRLLSMKNPAVTNGLVSSYGGEQDKNIKRAIVNSLSNNDGVKQLVAVARAEKDPEMVRYIVSRLANMKSPEAADYLMEIVKK